MNHISLILFGDNQETDHEPGQTTKNRLWSHPTKKKHRSTIIFWRFLEYIPDNKIFGVHPRQRHSPVLGDLPRARSSPKVRGTHEARGLVAGNRRWNRVAQTTKEAQS